MHLLFLVFYFIFYLFSSTTFAASSQTQMDISASVEPSCSVTSDNMNFGRHTSSATATSTVIKVLCTVGTNFSIELSSGNGKGASISNRLMINGNNSLRYALYQNSQNGKIWGNKQNALFSIGSGKLQIFKIYGVIPENQQSPPGYYFDNVDIKINIGTTSTLLTYQLSLSMLIEAVVKK